MRRGVVFATEAEALASIRAIDTTLGATEIRRNETTGETTVVPRKTWARPVALLNGTWAVPWKPKLGSVAGQIVRVDNADISVIEEENAVDVQDADIQVTEEENADLRGDP